MSAATFAFPLGSFVPQQGHEVEPSGIVFPQLGHSIKRLLVNWHGSRLLRRIANVDQSITT